VGKTAPGWRASAKVKRGERDAGHIGPLGRRGVLGGSNANPVSKSPLGTERDYAQGQNSRRRKVMKDRVRGEVEGGLGQLRFLT